MLHIHSTANKMYMFLSVLIGFRYVEQCIYSKAYIFIYILYMLKHVQHISNHYHHQWAMTPLFLCLSLSLQNLPPSPRLRQQRCLHHHRHLHHCLQSLNKSKQINKHTRSMKDKFTLMINNNTSYKNS